MIFREKRDVMIRWDQNKFDALLKHGKICLHSNPFLNAFLLLDVLFNWQSTLKSSATIFLFQFWPYCNMKIVAYFKLVKKRIEGNFNSWGGKKSCFRRKIYNSFYFLVFAY